ncbi:MAG: hypothetical protein KTR19_00435 [Hyphomicrobiales bacterium]|nr:hypothetical protein [Hyphomicrobiales bacterium]
MRLIAYATIAVAAGLLCGAAAPSKMIYQKGRTFSEKLVQLKAGEPLTFVNNDSVPHNIYSLSDGNEFDLGSQKPGMITDVTFMQPGDVDVLCAIHPRMKMSVKVVD